MATANGQYTQSGEDFTIPDTTNEKWNTTEWVIQALTALKNHTHASGLGKSVARVAATARIEDSAADHAYVLSAANLAADRTLSLPLLDAADTFAMVTFAQTLLNKTLTTPTLTTPQVNGVKLAVASKTANYTATATDAVLLCSASGGAFTITLPAASGNTGLTYWIKKTDSSANAVTIDGNAAETIDGAATATISVQFEALTIVSDGTSWHVV